MFRLIVPVVTAVVATMASACTRVDQQKFDALYRVAKEVEVDIDASSEVHIAESEKILKRFKTEISLLEGRTKPDAIIPPFLELPSATSRHSNRRWLRRRLPVCSKTSQVTSCAR